jgi:hypothetical protein
VGEELPFPEPHAERAEPLLLEDRARLPPGDPLGLRVEALGEIPDTLLAAAADDGHLAARVQHLQHQAHLALAPPAVRLAPVRAVILDLAREQRAAPLQLAQNVAAIRGVVAQVRDQAPVERAVAASHLGTKERQVLGGVEERVPLDERAVLPEEPVELGRVVALAEPAPEDEVLRRRDGGDRVELQEAEPLHRREDVGGAAVEELGTYGDPACLGKAHLTQAGCAPARSCVPGAARRARACRSRFRARAARG